jgi:RNA polymerase sigma-70 factor (ECF subfamily)
MVADEQLYEDLRPRAFAIAYRMLGSVASAEDIVQEGMLRLHKTIEAGEEIASPAAYLSTVVTRLAIDELRSARVKRETYVGEWLPEPLVTAEGDDPAVKAELADSLSMAFLALLESLTPEQRAVFLLRDVFDYPYDRIAEIVGKREAATRQLAVRARKEVDERRPRFESEPEQEERLAASFFAAVEDGDLSALEGMLAADVELHGDGGGKAPALARPVAGRSRVSRTLAAWGRNAARFGGLRPELTRINGTPGAIVHAADGKVISVMVLEISGGQIRRVNGVVNPDKLGHLGEVADVNALFAAARRG